MVHRNLKDTTDPIARNTPLEQAAKISAIVEGVRADFAETSHRCL